MIRIQNTHEPASDFTAFVKFIAKDAIILAEKQHNIDAFTAINVILANCFYIMTDIDPTKEETQVLPDEVLEWAKSLPASPRSNQRSETSDDMVKMIRLMAVQLEKGASETSFGYIISLLVGLTRAYYVVEGIDLLPLMNTNEVQRRLIDWAWHFRLVPKTHVEVIGETEKT